MKCTVMMAEDRALADHSKKEENCTAFITCVHCIVITVESLSSSSDIIMTTVSY